MDQPISLKVWETMNIKSPACNCTVYVTVKTMALFREPTGIIETSSGRRMCYSVEVGRNVSDDYVEMSTFQKRNLGVCTSETVTLLPLHDGHVLIAAETADITLQWDDCERLMSTNVRRCDLEEAIRWSYDGCLINVRQSLPLQFRNVSLVATVSGMSGGQILFACATALTLTSVDPTHLAIIDTLPEKAEVPDPVLRLFHCHVSKEGIEHVSVFRITTDSMETCRTLFASQYDTIDKLRVVSEADCDEKEDAELAIRDLRTILCVFLPEAVEGGDAFDLHVHDPTEYRAIITAFNMYCITSDNVTFLFKDEETKA